MEATEQKFSSKRGLQEKVSSSTVDGKFDTSAVEKSVLAPGWTAVAKLGGRSSYIECRVTEEEVVRLQQVFNETLVIPEERLVRKRE